MGVQEGDLHGFMRSNDSVRLAQYITTVWSVLTIRGWGVKIPKPNSLGLAEGKMTIDTS